MPAYFFHITFELYPLRSSPTTTFTPPPQTDIFQSELPDHHTVSWASFAPPTSTFSAIKSAASSSDVGHLPSPRERPPAARRFSQRTRASFSEHHDSPVPVNKPETRPTHRRTKSFAPKDWRFDTVSIQSIDMNPDVGDDLNRPRAKSLKQPSHASNSGGLATKGKFMPSDLKDTEVGWGVVHLYRDGQETPGLYDDVGVVGSASQDFNEEDCTTLCILAVPSYMTPSDFLGFVGERTREDVSHFRLIRTSRANKYMVLMKFRDAKRARDWRKQWNGKAFNSMEPEYCHVVFVKSISFQTADSNHDPSSYPDLTNDPFTPAPTKQPTAPLPSSVSSPVDPPSLAPSTLTAKPLAPPTPSLVELPTCPVCLERMDETTGLLTILCQHVFHCACLEKWRGSGCPVCRYTQNDSLILRGGSLDGDAPENECSVCGSTANLWICLICGNIGCGRYDSAHAFAHYEATSHTYAMDVVTQHVWDYAGDGYVHRLIQNKADGKLVDLPASTQMHPHPNSMTGYASDSVPREKLDNMGIEYTYLLTSQLESQRAYFEEQVERAADKAAKAASHADEAARSVTLLSQELSSLQAQYDEAQAAIKALEKDVGRQANRATHASELARKLTKQYQEEQTMNEALMTRITFLEKKAEDAESKLKEAEKQKVELEEQNRDLSFFISGQEKLREMQGNEIMGLQEGEVESGYVEVGKEEKKGRRKGKGKKL
ncbi:zf-UBP-domain-containing protein [Lindgomyces ingoldianus]|uniref:Zf-UBP-domain-containing protein n=1 Tax=Lindgomyces ingoldianus TaxID=673940 RepID=A0ACB6QEJ1_9PLEO|nr:zf-UBP-domain-containing protein [Lindgomyces ingoldianus]KAF2465403.1 zf-UBP-domain-containing protein [Lindgomyces ingoldianus]